MRRLNREIQHRRHAKHQTHLEILKPPSLSHPRLDMPHPMHALVIINEITEANHNQKRAAKGINHRRGFVQNMPVFRRSIQRQINHFHKSMTARHHHDDDWQHEPHHEHRHENSNRQEYLLPNLAHASQHLAVNHRVIKAKGNFQYYQNREQPQAARAEMSENQPAQRQCQQRRKPKNPKWVMRMPEMFHNDLV